MSDQEPLTTRDKVGFITAAIVAIVVFAIGYPATDGGGIGLTVSLVFAAFAGLMSLGFTSIVGKQQDANDTIIKMGKSPSIQCGKCDHVNGPGASFCESCGNRLSAPAG